MYRSLDRYIDGSIDRWIGRSLRFYTGDEQDSDMEVKVLKTDMDL